MTRKWICLMLAAWMLASLLCACNEVPAEETTGETQSVGFFEADPGEDGVLNILMIGDSFCYHYTDELYGMLADAGLTVSVTNAYHPDCHMEQHWNWLIDHSRKYQFITFNANGKSVLENMSLEEGLRLQNWDYISLQQHYTPETTMDHKVAMSQIEPYARNLYDYLEKKFPQARRMWHQTWAYQVGYEGPSLQDAAVGEEAKVLTREKQTACHETIRRTALTVSQTYGVTRVPCGDAWQLARADERVGDGLCARLSVNNGAGDNCHDGDVGGGQYLNACVWFEIITGKSCVDSKYRPGAYVLTDKLIKGLQEAAHQAVVAME